MNRALVFVFALLPLSLRAAEYNPADYKSGFAAIQALGRDIYRSLPEAEKKVISSQPISLDTSRKPFVRLLYRKDGAETIRGVWVSQGFIDLVNQVAHAKAIDRRKRGYFKKYMRSLKGAGDVLPPLPERANPGFWSEDIINEQWSNFNSIMGIVVATQLAQHYLGFYEKYAGEKKGTEEAEAIPLNQRLTRDEWEQSYRLGLQNAMQASCMTEGFLPVCEALHDLDHEPQWAVYFVPNQNWFGSMRKEMSKLQHDFLSH